MNGGNFMRYVVVQKENALPQVIIWAKSQYRAWLKKREELLGR